MKKIQRTSEGLINLQFDVLENVMASEEMSIKDKSTLVSKMVHGIRGIAGLELANKQFMAKSPEIAIRTKSLELVAPIKKEQEKQ